MPYLRKLDLENFRLFERLNWQPEAGINFILGDNGAGKTSILEALYYFSRGRSFRATKTKELLFDRGLNHNFDAVSQADKRDETHRIAKLRALVMELPAGKETPTSTEMPGIANKVGFSISDNERSFYLNGKIQRFHSVAGRHLPIVFVAPHNVNLVDAAPAQRRLFLDGVLVQLMPHYAQICKDYERCLKQRNKLLGGPTGPSKEILDSWDQQMHQLGEELEKGRQKVLNRLIQHISATLAFFNLERCRIGYERGWEGGISLARALEQSRAQDIRLGFTSRGCHRADFTILIRDRSALRVLSLGQQKLLSLAFFASVALMLEETKPLILMDDIASQLDDSNCRLLLDYFATRQNQVLITTMKEENLVNYGQESGYFLWQLEQGELKLISS